MKLDRKIWKEAEFIYTDYEPYFKNQASVWGQYQEFLDQKAELPYLGGMPVFYKDFELDEVSGKAVLYSSALGIYHVYINGKKVGTEEFKPGWTDYYKRALYFEHDVTECLKPGKNRLLAVVAPGWFSGRISNGYYGSRPPAFIASLLMGEKALLVTDSSFSAFRGGRIRFADIWDGELCDLSLKSYEKMSIPLEETGGDSVLSAKIFDSFEGELSPQIGPPIKVRDGLSFEGRITVWDGIKSNGSDYGEVCTVAGKDTLPVKVKRGEKVNVDFGQEITGWVKISFRAEKGTRIRIRYSEFLNDSGLVSRGNDDAKGSVYTVNMRSAKAKTICIAGGEGVEEYTPSFTFFGFRYVEIFAYGDIELFSATAETVGNDNRDTGHIETSDPLVNKLISNIIWGQRGNYLTVPTDCPQRDERLGWTGDAQAFSASAAYIADVYGFFEKWMGDARDSQGEDGNLPDTIPRNGCCSGIDSAAWTDAVILIPYNLYRIYGKKEIVTDNFELMDTYVRHLLKTYGYAGPNPNYGDWLAYEACDARFLSSAFLVHDLDLMIYFAGETGLGDVSFYTEKRNGAYAYFKEKYMKDGKLVGDTQTDYIIALAFGLIDKNDPYYRAAKSRLREKIIENGKRLSCGFVGTYNICPLLSEIGEDDLAYSLLTQKEEPSWLYSVLQGATTVWERWNSYTKKDGFGNAGMNSFNHYAYGAIMEWMFRYMAGIEPLEPGFRKIKLQPRIDRRADVGKEERIRNVRASLDSYAGKIESAWSTEDGFVYECTLPAPGKICLPLIDGAEKLSVNGKLHSITDFEREGNCLVINASPGKYVFEE